MTKWTIRKRILFFGLLFSLSGIGEVQANATQYPTYSIPNQPQTVMPSQPTPQQNAWPSMPMQPMMEPHPSAVVDQAVPGQPVPEPPKSQPEEKELVIYEYEPGPIYVPEYAYNHTAHYANYTHGSSWVYRYTPEVQGWAPAKRVPVYSWPMIKVSDDKEAQRRRGVSRRRR
ncbi:hypothetical protein ACQZV8_09185 [Magnetococcales bacterium HHB-1]